MHAHVCMHMYACTCMHAHVCMHMYTCTCMHAHVRMHMYACALTIMVYRTQDFEMWMNPSQ